MCRSVAPAPLFSTWQFAHIIPIRSPSGWAQATRKPTNRSLRADPSLEITRGWPPGMLENNMAIYVVYIYNKYKYRSINITNI